MYNNIAIRLAAQEGHLEGVKFLLTCKGVDPSAVNDYARRAAKQNGHIEVFKFLLDYGKGRTSQQGIFNQHNSSLTLNSFEAKQSFGMGFNH